MWSGNEYENDILILILPFNILLLLYKHELYEWGIWIPFINEFYCTLDEPHYRRENDESRF